MLGIHPDILLRTEDIFLLGGVSLVKVYVFHIEVNNLNFCHSFLSPGQPINFGAHDLVHNTVIILALHNEGQPDLVPAYLWFTSGRDWRLWWHLLLLLPACNICQHINIYIQRHVHT